MSSYPLTSIPPIGNINSYFKAVQQYPMLTLEEEQEYGRKVRDEGDQSAAAALILSHLRFVAATARNYQGYGLPEEDIIQEGNIGLMKAVKKFDPDHGIRLVSYAIYWIKAEIMEYVIKNYKIVRFVTTKSQRKLFFKLRSLKSQVQAISEHDSLSLTPNEVEFIAKELNVKTSDVIEMDQRINGTVYSLTTEFADDDGLSYSQDISDDTYEPTNVIHSFESDQMFSKIEEELENLNERERDIINQRWLLPMIGEKKANLIDLGNKYNISAERVRQIESKALSKIKASVGELETV